MNIKARAKDVVKYEAFGDAGGVIEELVSQLENVEAERDAALDAIERVRSIHTPTLPGYGPKSCVHDGCAWPCPTVAALDGAPEPEEKQ